MPGHFLLRPHVCRVPNHYSATQALKIALLIDTVLSSSYRNPHTKRTSSSQASKDTIAAVAGTAVRGDDTTARRPIFYSRPNYDADVNVHDLQATLDAHRTTNRASIIHPVKSDTQALPFLYRPAIDYLSSKAPELPVTADATNSAYIETPEIIHGGSEDTGPQAIAEVKPQKQHGSVFRELTAVGSPWRFKRFLRIPEQVDAHSLSRREEQIGEYAGISLWPAGPWSYQSSVIESPWLDYHQDESGDGYSR